MNCTNLVGISEVAVLDCAFVDNGKNLVCLFSNGTLRNYDTCSDKYEDLITESNPKNLVIAFSICPKNNDFHVATITKKNLFRLFSLEKHHLLYEDANFLACEDYWPSCLRLNKAGVLLTVAVSLKKNKKHKNKNKGPSKDDDDDEDEQTRILFYDFRQPTAQYLGCYKEAHTDEINDLKFAPFSDDYLLSGGFDGLVNVYDLKQTNEDDALLYTFNCENSVARVGFYGSSYEEANVYAVTDDNSIFIWHLANGDDVFIKKNASLNNCSFFVGCFAKRGPELFPVFSDSDGLLSIGQVVRKNSGNRYEITKFTSSANGKDLVRCIAFQEDLNLLAFGSDDGSVILCNVVQDVNDIDDKTRKSVGSSSKKFRSHPY